MQKRICGILPPELPALAERYRHRFRRLMGAWRQADPGGLDRRMAIEHDRQFARIDCTDCANCCKTTPALLEQDDMDRIAAHLGITTGEFIRQWVGMDEDGDFVFRTMPCPMLDHENRCTVYEVRPSSCRDYPHTRRKGQSALTGRHMANTAVCPAVFRILERLSGSEDA